MYVGYDCGMALLRNEEEHRAAFAARPAYLEGAERGLAGGEPWFCDYGIDLSRGNRALKVWTALETYGEAAFSGGDHRQLRTWRRLWRPRWRRSRGMELGAPVVSNVCVFTARSDLPPEAQSEVNAHIAQTLQESGEAVFSTTRAGGRVMLRAAITNHRSREADVRAAIAAVAREAVL